MNTYRALTESPPDTTPPSPPTWQSFEGPQSATPWVSLTLLSVFIMSGIVLSVDALWEKWRGDKP